MNLPPSTRSACALGIALLFLASGIASAQQKRLYLANDDHTDYMWTADAETYADVFLDQLDYYLALADSTDQNPSPYQSRFNADGSFWIWTYEHRKSAADFQRLIRRIKDGHISAPMTALVSCYGGQPPEAALRGMYYAGQLERKYDLRFSMAIAMENQTLPLGLASLWAGSGAKYSWRGVCGCASKLPNSVLAQRPHEIYWATGLDGQRVLMKWYSSHGNVGTYLEATNAASGIKYVDSDAGFLHRYRDVNGAPYQVAGLFGLGGDSLAQKTGRPADPGIPAEPGVKYVPGWPATEHFHDIARKESTAQRQIIASNEVDFFEDFEKTHGPTVPSETATHGNEWDLYSASMAETSARVRRAVEKLRAAELMSSLVSLQRPAFLHGREKDRDQAFIDLGVYWEHDWTADGPISRERRAAWEEKVAGEIEYYVNSLHADGAIRLGALIAKPEAKAERFFVLNPLGWTRTEAADFAYAGKTEIHVRDVSTGHDVPFQFIKQAGAPFLRILASDVPPAGYKAFEILGGPGDAPTDLAAQVSGEDHATFENSRVKLVIEPDGAIASLLDKAQPGADFAGNIGGLKLNDIAANDAAGNVIVVENAGPVSVTLKCVSGAGLAHTTRITLYRDSDRVEIGNEITENFRNVRHWAFSFNLTAPDVHTEELGAILHVKTKADGGDYADSHSRYDYATLNHFADITDGAGRRGVTLANSDCAFVRLGQSQPLALDITTPQLNVLAGGQVDGSSLGIRAQNGATYFLQRFALRPHGAYDSLEAMRFGLEHANPLVTGSIIGPAQSPYPAGSYSLFQSSDPAVLLWALKPHEDGVAHGLVARLWNLADTAGPVRLSTPIPLAGGARLTHLETPLQPLPAKAGALEVNIPAHTMQSFALEPGPILP